MQLSIEGVSVFIGIPVYGPIPPMTALALALTAQSCGENGVSLEIGMEQRGIITWCRDQVLHSFLKSDKQKLFWIDSDVFWEPDVFFRLLALSTKRDVVCGAYPAKVEGPLKFLVGGTGQPQEVDEFGLLEISGTGLGFTVMDRKVCQQIYDNAPAVYDGLAGEHLREVFRLSRVNGERKGEDIAFFDDIRALGHKVWLDPSVTLGHVGAKGWRGRILDTLERIDNG